MELFFREEGPAEGQPLVILHGLFGSSDNWMSVARQLADSYRIYLPDQRNHGQSGFSEEFDYASMSQDLAEFIRTHKLQQPVVMGHSMGGKVAMQLACQHPELLSRLIVVDIAPRAYPLHHQRILEGLNSIDVASLTSRTEAEQQMAVHVSDPGTRQFLLKNLYRTEQGGFAWRINVPVITRDIANIVAALAYTSPCQVPTLFIGGDRSDYIRPDDFPSIAHIFPNSKVEMVQGAGHWVHAEKPEELMALVRAFIG